MGGARKMNLCVKRICSILFAMFYAMSFALLAHAYSFNMLVPDVRQPVFVSGGSACPVRAHQLSSGGSIAVRWSTALNANPLTILTQNQTASGRPAEIEQAVARPFAAVRGGRGDTPVPASYTRL